MKSIFFNSLQYASLSFFFVLQLIAKKRFSRSGKRKGKRKDKKSSLLQILARDLARRRSAERSIGPLGDQEVPLGRQGVDVVGELVDAASEEGEREDEREARDLVFFFFFEILFLTFSVSFLGCSSPFSFS